MKPLFHLLTIAASFFTCGDLRSQPGTLNREPGTAAQRPNIILILTDDQRWDAMGFMGHPFLETPNMDRLARDGVHFENAFVTTSLCSPSRASILTGLYTHNHRVADNYNPLPDNLICFPEYLREGGYETAFIGKWHMGGEIDHPQPGFDHWISFKGQGVYYTSRMEPRVKGRFVPQALDDGYNINGKPVPQKKYITDELTDFALDWLNQRGTRQRDNETTERPFFLYLSHKAVHSDFLPADRHAYAYENEKTPRPEVHDNPGVPMWVQNQRNSRHGVEFAYNIGLDLAQLYRRYCETLLAVDESLGRLFSWLEESNHLDDTIIIYMSDNGFLFGEHGLIDKRNAYEESMRIPMLMHCPSRFQAGSKVRQVVATIDVAPTLLDAAGLAIPGHMDGRSFLPLIEGKDIPWRDGLLYEYMWERNYPQTPTTHAVRTERYKYIRYHGIWDLDELYDLEEDPGETNNLIDSPAHREIVAALNKRLFELLAESGGDAMPLVPDQGTRFLHRKRGGSPAAPFPPSFDKDPE